MQPSKTFFFFLPFLIHICPVSSCVNDTHCLNCQTYYISTAFGFFSYYHCDQCAPNTSLNSDSQLCICSKGYFQNYGTCEKCSSTCSSCSNSNFCQTCDFQLNRTLSNGICVCADGYQEQSGLPGCKQKPNILMIVLSAIGSIFCMIIWFIICAFVRMRRGSQIHLEERKKKNQKSSKKQKNEFNQTERSHTIERNTSMFWNPKSIEYKPEQICSICLDSNPMFMTQCNHYFHSKCIFDWINTKNLCPNCNNEIDAKSIRRWCQQCKKILMPVIMNISIKRQSSKKKREIIRSTPIQNQICEDCEIEKTCSDMNDINEKGESIFKMTESRNLEA